jgi:hypothetical protein
MWLFAKPGDTLVTDITCTVLNMRLIGNILSQIRQNILINSKPGVDKLQKYQTEKKYSIRDFN